MPSFNNQHVYLTLFRALVATGHNWWFKVHPPCESHLMPWDDIPREGCIRFNLPRVTWDLESTIPADYLSFGVCIACDEISNRAGHLDYPLVTWPVRDGGNVQFKVPLLPGYLVWPGQKYISSAYEVSYALSEWRARHITSELKTTREVDYP